MWVFGTLMMRKELLAITYYRIELFQAWAIHYTVFTIGQKPIESYIDELLW